MNTKNTAKITKNKQKGVKLTFKVYQPKGQPRMWQFHHAKYNEDTPIGNQRQVVHARQHQWKTKNHSYEQILNFPVFITERPDLESTNKKKQKPKTTCHENTMVNTTMNSPIMEEATPTMIPERKVRLSISLREILNF